MQETTFLNGSISALQQGEGKTSPVIFVHGYLDNANSFSNVLPFLSEYYCIAIDLPGHGLSAHRPTDTAYNLIDYVYDIYRLMLANKWEEISLVGHSLGGIICTIFAATFPEHVKQIITIESFGPLTEPEFTTTQQLRQSMISRQLVDKPIKQPESMASIVAARLRVSDIRAEHAQIILSRNTYEVDSKLYWRTDKSLRTKSSIRLTPNQAMDIIENVQCSYHVVLGSHGFSKVKQLFKNRKNVFKQLNSVQVEGGHHVHMEAPEAVAGFIQNCLKSN